MDEDNSVGMNSTDLDLNQEPTDPPPHFAPRLGSMLNESESTHGGIEERIRQLHAVTVRARQRRQARNSTEVSGVSGETMVNVDGERSIPDGNVTITPVERTPDRSFKRDSSHLVAKALAMDDEVSKVGKDGGSFFDCNICLDMAKEPVLTCCGHLFCWPCFCQVPFIDSTSKECPVCKGEVSNNNVIPIYGNGAKDDMYEFESGVMIPPRPKAQRVESLRQQWLNNGLPHVPVAEAIRRIRIGIGTMDDQTQQQQVGGVGLFSIRAVPQEGSGVATGSSRIRIHQVSRVLSESTASLSSLSSALSNAERLVEDMETVVDNRSPVDTVNPSAVNVQSNNQPPASTPHTNISQTADASGGVVSIRRMRASGEIISDPPAMSLIRRSRLSRNSDVDNHDAPEPSRRRLI